MLSRRKPVWFWVLGVILAIGLAAGYLTLERAKARAEALNCASSICSICLGGRLYANDHAGFFPTNFASFKDELSTPKVLRCATDRSRPTVEDWREFTETNSSYEIVNPGLNEDFTNQAFIRCRVHGHLGFPDGTVFDGVRRRGKNPFQ
jgi:hypothetical protein